ncbi:hypothetical protein [Microlunatus elymi]|nr:hypothetical protein [Microlunatus elymi]
MWFLVLCLLVVAGVVVYKNRVQIIAKLTGQPPDRIRRALEQRKNGHQ